MISNLQEVSSSYRNDLDLFATYSSQTKMSTSLFKAYNIPRFVVEEPAESLFFRYTKRGRRRRLRNEVEWVHFYEHSMSRLVMTVDMSAEATEFRNRLQQKYFHRWGYYPDTRFVVIDPLPDRPYYINLYKDIINEFCSRTTPRLPVGPSQYFSFTTEILSSELEEEDYTVAFESDPHYKKPNEPKKGHFLIIMSMETGATLHKLRDYFLEQFHKIPNAEIQKRMEKLKEETYKAQVPLGFARKMGEPSAMEARKNVWEAYKEAGGIHLGDAVGLSLWRHTYHVDQKRLRKKLQLLHRECVYSRALDGISQRPSFVSPVSEEQPVEEKINEPATESRPEP